MVYQKVGTILKSEEWNFSPCLIISTFLVFRNGLVAKTNKKINQFYFYLCKGYKFKVDKEYGGILQCLEDIFQFITGITHVRFVHNPEIEFSYENLLPSASTCLLKLCLPVANSRINFKRKFTFVVFNAIGFGNTYET